MKRFYSFILMAVLCCCVGSIQAAQLNEGFEDTGFPPDGWSIIHVSGSNYGSVVQWARNTSYKKTGSACAYVNYASSGHENYLVTPQLHPAAGEKLSFYVSAQSYANTTFTVEVSTASADKADFTNVLATYTTGSSGSIGTTNATTFVLKEIDLADYVGQNIYIAFHVVDNDGSSIYLDDVTGVSIITAGCPKPTGLTVSGIDEKSAKVSWTEKGEATAWQICLNDDESDLIDADSNENVELSLESLHNYSVKVRAVCNETEQSEWSSAVSFSTLAEPEEVGEEWSDDFESELGWQLINGSCTNAWAWGTAAHSEDSEYGLYISNDGGTTNAYTNNSVAMVYATKLLTFENGKYQFSYDWLANGEGNYDYLRVALVPATVTLEAGTSIPSGFSTTGLPTGWIALDGGSKLNLSTTWQSKSLAINVTAGNYHLVVAWRDDTSGGSNPAAAVDNFFIQKLACAYDVADLAVAEDPAVTTTTATITWAANEEVSQWEVQYSLSSSFPEDETESVEATENSIALEGLSPASIYYVKVRAVCDADNEDFGSWSETISFTTACEVVTTFPWNENFDGMTIASAYTPSEHILPTCWSAINTSTYSTYKIYPTVYYYSFTDYSHSTPNLLRFYSGYGSWTDYDPQNQYAILPEMDNIAGKQIIFWAKAGTAGHELKIGSMSDPADASTFHLIASKALTTSYAEYIVELEGAVGNYIALMIDAANSTVTSRTIDVDDIRVEAIPNCKKPSGLAHADIKNHSVQLSWTENGEASAWQIAYKTAEAEDFTIVDADANPFVLTGLAAETAYTAKVRANCDESDKSDWSSAVSFTTLIACPAPEFNDDNIKNITANTADIEWEGDADNYKVNYRTAFYVDGFEETFDAYDVPTGWTRYTGLVDGVVAGTAELASSTGGWGVNSNVFGAYNLKVNVYGTSCKSWLVTPEIAIQDNYSLNFDIALSDYGNSDPIEDATAQEDDRFVVLVYADEAWTILREWNNSGSEYIYNEVPNTGANISDIDIAAYAGKTVKFAFYCESTVAGGDNDFHIDNVRVGIAHEAGAWTEKEVAGKSTQLTGLDAETKYDVQVIAVCGGSDGESLATGATFTTVSSCQIPDGLVASELQATSVKISWNTYGKDVFNIRYGIKDSEDPKTIVENIANGYVLTNLVHKATYEVQVQPTCAGDDEWSAILNVTPKCASPRRTKIEFSDITSSSVTVKWDSAAYMTAYQYACIKSGEDRVWTLVEDTTVSISGLDAATEYTFYVRSYLNDQIQSDSVFDTFITECTIFSMPFSENFNSLSYGIPNCWDNSEGTTTSASSKWSYYETGHEGTCVRFDSYNNSNGKTNILATPTIHLDKAAMLSFWCKNPAGGAYEVKIAQAGSDERETLFDNLTAISDWTQKEADLSDYIGQDIIIYFCGTSNYGSGYDAARLYLDDIEIYEKPSCSKPTDVVISEVETTSAKIAWTAGGSETAWQICLNGDEGNLINATTNPFTLTSLTPATAYSVKVRAICNSEDMSDWSIAADFRTECANITVLPWNENFESFDANTVPYCWDNSASTTSTLSSSSHYVWGVYEYSSIKMLRMNNYSVQAGTALINSPVIELPASPEYELTFDYSHTATCGDFIVKVSADNGANWSDVKTLTKGSGSSYTDPGEFTSETVNLADYAGKSIMLQFFANANWGNGAIFVDNLSIHEVPSCAKPSDVQISNIAQSSATIAWTVGGDATAWQICLNGDEENLIDADANPFELTNLAANTAYSVKVRAICGDDHSDWSNAANFRTACGAVALPFNEDFEDGIDCWTLVNCESSTGISTDAKKEGSYSFMFRYNSNPPQYLISPELIASDKPVDVEFYYKNYSNSNIETFKVGYSTSTNDISDFTWDAEETSVADNTTWGHYSDTKPANVKYVAIQYTSYDKFYLYIDDFSVTVSASDPTAVSNTANAAQIIKRIENGLLLIEVNGVIYNAQGQVVTK